MTARAGVRREDPTSTTPIAKENTMSTTTDTTTTRVLYISDAPSFVQGLPVGTVIVHLRTDPPTTVPQAAERTGDDQWTVSDITGQSTVTDAEIGRSGLPWMVLAAPPADAADEMEMDAQGRPRLSDDFIVETFTRSADYEDPSFIFGRSPSGRLLAYCRRWVPTDAADLFQWAPITQAPPMPDSLADRLCTEWRAARVKVD